VDGATGLTVPPGDAAALARALCRLLGDPWLREKLALAGRDWVLERFNEDRQIQRTEALYQLALSRLGRLPRPDGVPATAWGPR